MNIKNESSIEINQDKKSIFSKVWFWVIAGLLIAVLIFATSFLIVYKQNETGVRDKIRKELNQDMGDGLKYCSVSKYNDKINVSISFNSNVPLDDFPSHSKKAMEVSKKILTDNKKKIGDFDFSVYGQDGPCLFSWRGENSDDGYLHVFFDKKIVSKIKLDDVPKQINKQNFEDIANSKNYTIKTASDSTGTHYTVLISNKIDWNNLSKDEQGNIAKNAIEECRSLASNSKFSVQGNLSENDVAFMFLKDSNQIKLWKNNKPTDTWDIK